MSTAEPANALTTQMKRQFEVSRRMVDALISDFTQEEATARVGDFKPLVWYLGHMIVTEHAWLELHRGVKSGIPDGHMDRFGRGSDGSADFSDAKLADLVDVMKSLRKRVRDEISALEPGDLEHEATVEVFEPLKISGNAFALMCAHNAYHAGQIQLLRRAMGKPATFG